MSRLFIGFTAAIAALVLAGCPAADEHGGPESPATGQESGEQQWTTVASLRSSNPTFQDLDNRESKCHEQAT